MDTPCLSIGEYLIQRIYDYGARHVLGVPGDYILNFYARLQNSRIQVINTCDEQGTGFAADAYARIHGLGVVCVTYNVGGLKVLNPVAGAYTEQSPVLVIAGARDGRNGKNILFFIIKSGNMMTSSRCLIISPLLHLSCRIRHIPFWRSIVFFMR